MTFLEFDDREDTRPSAASHPPTAPEENLERRRSDSRAPAKTDAACAESDTVGPSAEQRRRRRIFFTGLSVLGGLVVLRLLIAVRMAIGVGAGPAASSAAAASSAPVTSEAAVSSGAITVFPSTEDTLMVQQSFASAPSTAPALPSSEAANHRGPRTNGVTRTTQSPSLRSQGATAHVPVDDNKSGMLQVVVLPWADVTVDGRSVGTTPIPAIPLAPGMHLVVLRNAELGASRRMSVVIKPGAPALLRVDLRRAP